MESSTSNGKRGLAYRILAVLCVIALAFAAIGASAAAYAEDSDSDTASITVTGATEGDTYYAYKLFDGTFSTDDDGNTVMGEAVVNSDYEQYIVEALLDMGVQVNGYSYTTDSDGNVSYSGQDSAYSDVARANNLMDAIEALQEDDTDTAGSTNRSFANTLADYLEGATATASNTVSSEGTVVLSDLAEGYYLVTSESTGNSSETTGLLVQADGDVEVSVKTSTPTVDKEAVADETTGAYLIFNDDGTASVSYIVTGTVASNIADFDAYYYSFVDDLPDGITITDTTSKIDSWSVTVVNGETSTDVSDCFTMTAIDGDDDSAAGDEVAWHADDLLSLTDSEGSVVSVDADSQIVLSYTITICESEVEALFGSSSTTTSLDNTASIIFSNDPSAEGSGVTDEDNDGIPDDGDEGGEWDDDNDASETPSTGGDGGEGENGNNGTFSVYSLAINKVDEDGEALAGADFTLTLADGSTVYESTSEDNGTFTFSGLAEGVTYTITETNTPDGYKSIDQIVFKIEADDDGNVTIVESSDASEAGTAQVSGNAITYTVVNVAGVSLPFTGGQGIALGVLVGAAVIIVSIVAIRSRRKRADA